MLSRGHVIKVQETARRPVAADRVSSEDATPPPQGQAQGFLLILTALPYPNATLRFFKPLDSCAHLVAAGLVGPGGDEAVRLGNAKHGVDLHVAARQIDCIE